MCFMCFVLSVVVIYLFIYHHFNAFIKHVHDKCTCTFINPCWKMNFIMGQMSTIMYANVSFFFFKLKLHVL